MSEQDKVFCVGCVHLAKAYNGESNDLERCHHTNSETKTPKFDKVHSEFNYASIRNRRNDCQDFASAREAVIKLHETNMALRRQRQEERDQASIERRARQERVREERIANHVLTVQDKVEAVVDSTVETVVNKLKQLKRIKFKW